MRHSASFVFLVLLGGCAARPTADSDEAALRRLYEDAIRASAVRSPLPEVPLRTIPLDQDTVRAATFTEFPAPSGRLGPRHTWFSLPEQLRGMCSNRPDPVLAIQQVLGLEPAARPRQPGNSWKVVLLDVARKDVFRPCPGGVDVAESSCHHRDPPDAPALDEPAARFLLRQLWRSYRVGFEEKDASGATRPLLGSPFTGMGYSYNWDPGAGSRVGVSEFVIRPGAAVRNVVALTPGEFCGGVDPSPRAGTAPLGRDTAR